MIELLSFKPSRGLTSPHAQTLIAGFARGGIEPPSKQFITTLPDGDKIVCEVSTPVNWHPSQKTILMVHGLGGSHSSHYMVRMARKLYQRGYRAVRINLRGAGSGKGLARLCYHAGLTDDILQVIDALKQQTPLSPFILIGFSLGGGMTLKLLGELKERANLLLQHTIVVCPAINLAHTADIFLRPLNHLYHRYYLKDLQAEAYRLKLKCKIKSFFDFDNLITAPTWGFKDAKDYYQQCSSQYFVGDIQHPCRILFTSDDPFIDYRSILNTPLPSSVKVFLCQGGGHLGFFGWSGKEHRYFWLDHLLLKWITEDNHPRF
jgi:predicted alpha/beta-fold hydrolase